MIKNQKKRENMEIEKKHIISI